MPLMNHQILLASRPQGIASEQNFRAVETPLPPLADAQVCVRNYFLSIDPYMLGRMKDAKSYAAPQPLGEVMGGASAGVIVESSTAKWCVGDRVVSNFGWQEYGISDGANLIKVDDASIPLSAYLGVLGMPGITAWYGLHRICAPKAGDTLVVSAASGGVGSVVGQLAKRSGCHVVGIAGGPEKCRYVTDELGFDACVDYKAGGLNEALQAAAPAGIDAYFDNVGGETLDSVMRQINPFGRIAICGAIAGYDGTPLTMANPALILTSRLKLQGFIISDHKDDWAQAEQELHSLVAARQLKFRESISPGLASAPAALLGLLHGRNFGKQLVKLL